MKFWFMDIKINDNPFLVFDLDDTLYSEFSYLKSAFKYIADLLEPKIQFNIFSQMVEKYKTGENVFTWILLTYKQLEGTKFTNDFFLNIYRTHSPEINLYKDAYDFLKNIRQKNIPAGIITDGRSITQRNKLKALGLQDYFKEVIISEEFGSEKPSPKNYTYYEELYPGKKFFYFGDNLKKDFISPLELGWKCICLQDRGDNIHSQPLMNLPTNVFLAKKFDQILVF